MIVGQPGSGKSSLALRLGEVTGLPVIHIDRIHWQPGWIERSKAEKTRLCLQAEAGERWIFEGGHSRTWPSRLARADLLVWIDRPLGLRLWRVLRRAFTQLGQTRPDMADGCPERLRSLPEFAYFIVTTARSHRRNIVRLARSAICRVEHLRSNAEAAVLVERVRLAFATDSV